VIKKIDFTSVYIEDIKSIINIDLIKSAGLKLHMMPCMVQARCDGSDPSLQVSIRGDFNPSFGGSHPEPLPQNTKD